MSAYNQLRGAYCSENDYLLNRVLKGAWGFDGVVISEWGATHSMLGSARYGIDLEMNGTAMYEDYFLGRPFLEAVKSDRKSTRLNSSHSQISYDVFCLKTKRPDSRPVGRVDRLAPPPVRSPQ